MKTKKSILQKINEGNSCFLSQFFVMRFYYKEL